MLAVTGVLAVVSIIAVYWAARVAMSVGRDLRSEIFGKVESFSQVEVNHFGAASLITRNTNDVQQVQMVVLMGLTVMVTAPIMMIGGLIMALRQDIPLTGLLLVIVPIMIVVIGSLVRRAMPLFRDMQVRIDRINKVMRETLAGIRVIRAFVRTDYEERRFDRANLDLFGTAHLGQPSLRSHDADPHGDHEPDDGGRPLVRSDPGRQRPDVDREPDRLPAVHHPDPLRHHDGDLHVRDRAASRSVERPDQRGARDGALDQRP